MTDFKPRQTVVTLFQGDDLDPFAQKLKDVERVAAHSVTQRIGDTEPLQNASGDFDAFMDDATLRAIKVRLQALPRKQFRALRNHHPARMVQNPEDPAKLVLHEDDEAWGFNFETFPDALLLGDRWDDGSGNEVVIPPSIVEVFSEAKDVAPDTSTPALMQAFVDALSDTEFSHIVSRTLGLNEGDLPDPKVRLSTLLDRTSDEISESPQRLG